MTIASTTTLIDIGGRIFVLPENVQLIAWKPLRTPHVEQGTGVKNWAAVIVETYHDAHFVPCATADEARALAETVRASIEAARALRAVSRGSVTRHDAAPRDDGVTVMLLAGEAA